MQATVFGYFQGNKGMLVNPIDIPEAGDLKFFQIVNKEDRSICLERDGIYYRMFPEQQLQKAKEQMKILALEGKTIVDLARDLFDRKMALLETCELKVFADANIAGYLDRMGDYAIIMAHDEKVAIACKAKREAETAAKNLQVKTEADEREAKVLKTILAGESVSGDDLALAAKLTDIVVPLRTHGWLLAKCHAINSSSCTVTGKKASPTAFRIYSAVQEKLLKLEGVGSET